MLRKGRFLLCLCRFKRCFLVKIVLKVIPKKKSFTRQEDGTYLGHDVYRLTKSYRDADGRERKAHVLYLGGFEGFTESDRKELAAMLTQMIERGQSVLSDNAVLYEKAMELYVIRTVEETFHTLKSDLDIRPVYHKSDTGIKAHLNLAVLAY